MTMGRNPSTGEPTMSKFRHECAVIGVYGDQAAAEAAVHNLQQTGVRLPQISVMGRDWQAREAVEGFWSITPGEEKGLVRDGERFGLRIGSLFGLLEGFALLLIPGLGSLVILGPIAGLVVGGSLGALVGIMSGHAEAEDLSSKYRERLTTGRFLVVITGPIEDQADLQLKMKATNPLEEEVLPLEVRKAVASA